MIRFFLILIIAILFYFAGKFVFSNEKHKLFRFICYGLSAIFGTSFVYIIILSQFIDA